MAKRDPIYGLMAEFDSAQALLDGARKTHQAGYKKIDAYTPRAWPKRSDSTTMRFPWSC